MYERTPQQLKTRAILSWILTAALGGYYVYLGMFTDYDITPIHIFLVVLAVVFSVTSTYGAIKANKDE